MEYYEKGEVCVLEDVIPVDFAENCLHMKVSYGSKVKNLMGYAIKKIKEPGITQVSWTGHGKAFQKTVSCAQIFKTKIKGLHRLCNVRYLRTEEYWEPKIEGLDRLKVNIDVPAVTVLLSKVPVKQEVLEESISTPKELEVLLQKALRDSQRNIQRDNDKDRRQHGNPQRSHFQRQGENTKSTPKKSSEIPRSEKTDRQVTNKHSQRSSPREERNNETNEKTPRKNYKRGSHRERTVSKNSDGLLRSSEERTAKNDHNAEESCQKAEGILNNNDTKHSEFNNNETVKPNISTTRTVNKKQDIQTKVDKHSHRQSSARSEQNYKSGVNNSSGHSCQSNINSNNNNRWDHTRTQKNKLDDKT